MVVILIPGESQVPESHPEQLLPMANPTPVLLGWVFSEGGASDIGLHLGSGSWEVTPWSWGESFKRMKQRRRERQM